MRKLLPLAVLVAAGAALLTRDIQQIRNPETIHIDGDVTQSLCDDADHVIHTYDGRQVAIRFDDPRSKINYDVGDRFKAETEEILENGEHAIATCTVYYGETSMGLDNPQTPGKPIGIVHHGQELKLYRVIQRYRTELRG